MRGEYNTFCNVWIGDNGQNLPPATFKILTNVPCRVVEQTQITYAGAVISDIAEWVTLPTGLVFGAVIATAFGAHTFQVNAWMGNVLEILDGSGRWFQILWTQKVAPPGGSSYDRAIVLPYPLTF